MAVPLGPVLAGPVLSVSALWGVSLLFAAVEGEWGVRVGGWGVKLTLTLIAYSG